jgi:membrane-associated protease RseP (regulator of RpoE activity)
LAARYIINLLCSKLLQRHLYNPRTPRKEEKVSTVIAIAILLIIVVIHEAGHATVAKMVGYKVEGIYIGLPAWPKKTFILKGKPITLSPWLIGGGVGINDEAYYSSPLWKKAVFVLAGPVTNVVAGFAAAIIAFGPKIGTLVTIEFLTACSKAILMLITGQIGIGSLSGPVGVVNICSGIITVNALLGTLFVWLLLNFAFTTMNLLPIPALDGGQLVVGVICSIFGNTPTVIKIAKKVTLVFFLAILVFMGGIIIKDIVNLFH